MSKLQNNSDLDRLNVPHRLKLDYHENSKVGVENRNTKYKRGWGGLEPIAVLKGYGIRNIELLPILLIFLAAVILIPFDHNSLSLLPKSLAANVIIKSCICFFIAMLVYLVCFRIKRIFITPVGFYVNGIFNRQLVNWRECSHFTVRQHIIERPDSIWGDKMVDYVAYSVNRLSGFDELTLPNVSAYELRNTMNKYRDQFTKL